MPRPQGKTLRRNKGSRVNVTIFRRKIVMQHQPSLKANSNGWCSRRCHNFPKGNCDVAPAFAEEVPMCRRRISHGTGELPPTLGRGDTRQGKFCMAGVPTSVWEMKCRDSNEKEGIQHDRYKYQAAR